MYRILGIGAVLVAVGACGDDAAPSMDAGADAAGGDAGSGPACLSDGDCDDGLFCNGEESCGAGACTAGAPPACDDGIACTADVCDEERRECVSTPRDDDADGVVDIGCLGEDGLPLGLDCDDSDAERYPGNAEVCDAAAHDEDCDPTTYGAVDGDADGHDDLACCNVAGDGTMHCGDDCNDGDENVSPSDVEICNAVDDDCDGLTDDIVDGSFVCAAGDSRACTSTCGLSGTQACDDTCLAWQPCVAPEVCNGCDDDSDGADDDGFECIQGASGTCTTVCGSTGSRICSDTCGWGACTTSEICNYCDDNGDGNFFEERPMATVDPTVDLSGCGGGDYTLAGAAACGTVDTTNGFDLWATLIDGTAVPQSGAWWFEPADWALGWGPITMEIEVEATAVTAGGGAEMPLGGWAIVVGRGTTGAGAPDAAGIPTTIDGIAARWWWSGYAYCPSGGPPSPADGTRGYELSGGGIMPLYPTGVLGASCSSSEGIEGGATDLDGPGSGTVRERMRVVYTPDDPTTVPDEESLAITASTPGAGGSLTRTYVPTDALPVGSQPLRIGVTAGTHTDMGFSGPPAGLVFGVPVRVRFKVMVLVNNCCGPPTITYPYSVSRVDTCP